MGGTTAIHSLRGSYTSAAWHGAARMCREEASRPRAVRWLGRTAASSEPNGAAVKLAGGADARVATTDEILMRWRHL